MQVNMKDFLHGDCAVSEEQIHAFTANVRAAKASSHPLGNPEEMASLLLWEISQVRGVVVGNYEKVPRVYRLNIQKHRAHLVAMEKCRRCFSSDDPTEDAIEFRHCLQSCQARLPNV